MTPRLFVSGLWEHESEEEIRDLFSAYGAVCSVKLVRRSSAGGVSGYALVEMGTVQQAADANRALNNTEVRGCRLCVVQLMRCPRPSLSVAKRPQLGETEALGAPAHQDSA